MSRNNDEEQRDKMAAAHPYDGDGGGKRNDNENEYVVSRGDVLLPAPGGGGHQQYHEVPMATAVPVGTFSSPAAAALYGSYNGAVAAAAAAPAASSFAPAVPVGEFQQEQEKYQRDQYQQHQQYINQQQHQQDQLQQYPNQYQQKETTTTSTTSAAEIKAVPIPLNLVPGGSREYNAMEKKKIRMGDRKGREGVQEESEGIQRAGRKIHTVHYNTEQENRAGNRNAAIQNRMEETGMVQTTFVAHQQLAYENATTAPVPTRTEPEFYPGTYGSEYQIAEYQMGEYQTSDYETTEYKSVYER